MNQNQHDRAIELIDLANAKDSNKEIHDGKECPKELLYSYRMSDMLQRYRPDANDVVKLAIRAQHIERWKSPRSSYPIGRNRYLKWRTDLYNFHADTIAKLLVQAGYTENFINRVRHAVGKKSLKINPNTQLLEDVANLVFIEHYFMDFTTKHAEYDKEKWLNIIRKIWKKMSGSAQQFSLSGSITLPESLIPIINEAISVN